MLQLFFNIKSRKIKHAGILPERISPADKTFIPQNCEEILAMCTDFRFVLISTIKRFIVCFIHNKLSAYMMRLKKCKKTEKVFEFLIVGKENKNCCFLDYFVIIHYILERQQLFSKHFDTVLDIVSGF